MSKSIFRRIARYSPWTEPDEYEISMNGESCRLPAGLLGLEYLHLILSADKGREFIWTVGGHAVQREVRPVALAFGSESQTEALRPRSLKPSQLENFIRDMERRAKEALKAGDKAEYDRLMAGAKGEAMGLTGVRKYQREVTGSFGRSRRFSDQGTRERDAVSHAIAAAIKEIRKHCPGIAQHLKNHILPDGRGCWFYNGDTEDWETQSCLPEGSAPLVEEGVDGVTDAVSMTVGTVSATGGGRPKAVALPPMARGVQRTFGQTERVQIYIPKCQNFSGLEGAITALRVWRKLNPRQPDNSFGIYSPASISREQNEAIDYDETEAFYEKNFGKRYGNREYETAERSARQGDDRESADFD